MAGESSQLVTLKSSSMAFPRLCPRCLSPYPTETYKTEFSEMVDRRGKIETWRTTSVNIPICRDCDRKVFGLRRYLKWGLIILGVLTVLGPAVGFSLIGAGSGSTDIMLAFMGGMVMLLIGLTAYSVFSPAPPIEMFTGTWAGATLNIKNESYAQLFRQSNQPVISEVKKRIVKPRTIGLVIAGVYGVIMLMLGLTAAPLVLTEGLGYIVMPLWLLSVGLTSIAGVVMIVRTDPWLGRRLIYAAGIWGIFMIFGIAGIVAGALALSISEAPIQELPPPPP